MAAKLYVCGTRGSFPTFGRPYEGFGQATTCYVIREDDYAILMDCGTGIVNAVPVLQGCNRVDVILTHVHYDHIMGLFIIPDPCPGVRLTFYGNFDAWTAVSNKGKGGSHTFWPDTIKNSDRVAIRTGEEYSLDKGFKLRFAPSTHGNGACMAEISRNGRRFVFTGDYEEVPGSGIAEFVRDCDWLLYDGSYSPEEYPGHEGWGHSTWKNACELAMNCNVGKVLITHYANTHDDASLMQEEKRAKQLFPNVSFAREGQCYPLTEGPAAAPYPYVYLEEEAGRLPPEEEPECVKIRPRQREEELKKIEYTGWLQRKSFMAAGVNILIVLLTGLVLYSVLIHRGIGGLLSCPMLLLLAVGGISMVLCIYDLKSVDFREGSFISRPRIVSAAFLFETAAVLVNLLSLAVFWLPAEGIRSLSGGSWPGGITSGILIPGLVLLEFAVLEAEAKVRGRELLLFGLFPVIQAVSAVYAKSCGLTGLLYESFSALPQAFVYAGLYTAASLAVYFRNRVQMRSAGFRRISYPGRREKTAKRLFARERERQVLYLAAHLLIALTYLGAFLTALEEAEGRWYGGPMPAELLLVLISLVSAAYNVKALVNNSAAVYPLWYKYLSYVTESGTLISFVTVHFLYLSSGTGFAEFLEPHWGVSALTGIVMVLLSTWIFFMETQEYDRRAAIASVLTFTFLLTVSWVAAKALVKEVPRYSDMELFLNSTWFWASFIIQLLLGAIVYIADRIYIDNARFRAGETEVKRDPQGAVKFTVCGARGGVAPTKPAFYRFGQAANCYVIRDGSYGMILDCGSGLVYAPEVLKGCTEVDVFLSDTRFSTVMGLLAVPNPCPGARIRFFGPFGRGLNFENMNGFATPPLWPVNVIVGECIAATPEKDIRLNNRYSVRFCQMPEEKEHYVIRISGAVGICYTGPLDHLVSGDPEWAKDCDILVADGHIGSNWAVRLAGTGDAGYLLVANHHPFADDKELITAERRARMLRPQLSYARQGRSLQIG